MTILKHRKIARFLSMPLLALFLCSGILSANPAWAAEDAAAGASRPSRQEQSGSAGNDAAAAPASDASDSSDLDLALPYAQVPSLPDYAKEFGPDLLHGTGRIFSRDNLSPALIGLGATALAFVADQKAKDYFREQQPMGHVSKYGNAAGKYYYHIGIGVALAGAGRFTNNRQLSDTGIVVLESLFVNGAATMGLKYLTNRPRPNRRDRQSFPSAHASSAAALSASISEMYDWHPGVSIPLYAATLFVGASRIQDDMHHLSDVTAGIALGTIVGRSLALYQKEKRARSGNKKHISFTPVFEEGLKGGMFTMKW